ncbi:MAG: glycosyltransferase [bacterium]
MNTVLILAYYFPPLGMGGTQRVAKFVKYLPQFGWRPLVVTVKDVAYYAKDTTLLEDVTAAEVFRTGSLDPQRLLACFARNKPAVTTTPDASSHKRWRVLNKIAGWVFIPDLKVLWLPFAFVRAFRIIRQRKVECLLTTSPPHSTHLTGWLLKKLTGIRWVADFRDGWSQGDFQIEPARLHRWLNRKLEQKVIQTADAVIGVSAGLVQKLAQLNLEVESKFHLITNGYDQEDLLKIKSPAAKDKFTMTYCGSVSAMAPLTSLVNSLHRLLKSQPDLRGKMVLELVGLDLEGKVTSQVHQFRLQDVVQQRGYVSHLMALETILYADLLLYPIAPRATQNFIPGKTFEYLAARKPVLALGPAVEGVEILRAHSSVERVDHADTDAIQNVILTHFNEFYNRTSADVAESDISVFERKALTEKLAALLK